VVTTRTFTIGTVVTTRTFTIGTVVTTGTFTRTFTDTSQMETYVADQKNHRVSKHV
jgi:hypothetical protein